MKRKIEPVREEYPKKFGENASVVRKVYSKVHVKTITTNYPTKEVENLVHQLRETEKKYQPSALGTH